MVEDLQAVPVFFPGFGIGASSPDFSSAGYLPVFAIVFSSTSIAIPMCISGGPYLTYSAFSPSSPTLFRFFMLLNAFSISSVVKGVFISAGFMIIAVVAADLCYVKCTAISMFSLELCTLKWPSDINTRSRYLRLTFLI